MTVLLNNGNENDHAVGLVAVSSWQGWLRHSPKQTDTEQEGYGASNLGRLWSTFSVWNPKAAFGYFKNGHTALCVRRGGRLKHVVGFNPNSYLYAGILQNIWGNAITVLGLWYDDSAMINDPTAVGYEINVTGEQAKSFGKLAASLVGRSDLGPNSPNVTYKYSFLPGKMEAEANADPQNEKTCVVGNCGNMAMLVLCQFLNEVGKENYVQNFVKWVRKNQSTQNFGQGPMMGAVSTGFGNS
jgi:hypothetical protein